MSGSNYELTFDLIPSVRIHPTLVWVCNRYHKRNKSVNKHKYEDMPELELEASLCVGV